MNEYRNDQFPAGTLAYIDVPGGPNTFAMRRYINSIDMYDWAVTDSTYGDKQYSCYSDHEGVTNVRIIDFSWNDVSFYE